MLRRSGLLPRITSYTRVRWPMTPINALESLPFCSNRNLIASMGSGRSMALCWPSWLCGVVHYHKYVITSELDDGLYGCGNR
jgi:hypothetical protein